MIQPNNPHTVIVISSHVARGSVGNRAAVFALETLGFQVWAIPTVILPWHPGHGPATRLDHDSKRFGEFLADISNAPWLAEVTAVLTGYMASSVQVEQVADLVRSLKAKSPDLTYLCDPVIGDKSGLYVAETTAEAIKTSLLPLAGIVTPNRFELEWLATGKLDGERQNVDEMASKLPSQTKLVTSVQEKPEKTGNRLIEADNIYQISHPAFQSPPNGPGDLTASVFLAHLLDGHSSVSALEMTTSSVFEVLQNSVDRNSDELMLETDVKSLLNPKTRFAAEKQ